MVILNYGWIAPKVHLFNTVFPIDGSQLPSGTPQAAYEAIGQPTMVLQRYIAFEDDDTIMAFSRVSLL